MLKNGSSILGSPYEVLTLLAQGSMSKVYLVVHQRLNRIYVLKEYSKQYKNKYDNEEEIFAHEADMLMKFHHPGIPRVVDLTENEDSFGIVMEYITGQSLMNMLDIFGAQPQESVIQWAKQLCDILTHLHTRTPAVIYRDLKPSNILLDNEGNLHLVSFVCARTYKKGATADTKCLGTVGYAAPEQFGGMGQTDVRTDIYGLGVTLYQLVTGTNPCEPPYEIKPIRQINPSLSKDLENIILKCTQRNPNDRYQSAAELLEDIEKKFDKKSFWKRRKKKIVASKLSKEG